MRRPTKARPNMTWFIEAELPGVTEVDAAAEAELEGDEPVGLPVEALGDGVLTAERLLIEPDGPTPREEAGPGAVDGVLTTERLLTLPDGPRLRLKELAVGMTVAVVREEARPGAVEGVAGAVKSVAGAVEIVAGAEEWRGMPEDVVHHAGTVIKVTVTVEARLDVNSSSPRSKQHVA